MNKQISDNSAIDTRTPCILGGSECPQEVTTQMTGAMQRKTKGGLWFFSGSAIFLTMGRVASNILILRWLPPEVMGVWQVVAVARSYVDFLRLGVVLGMGRELPFLLGAGRREEAEQVAQTAQGYSIVCFGMTTLFGIGVLPFIAVLGSNWVWALAAGTVVSASGFLQTYFLASLRSLVEFRKLAWINILHSILAMASPLAAYFWGFSGFCVSKIIIAIGILCATYVLRPMRLQFSVDFQTLKRLMPTGGRLFIYSQILVLAAGFDRLILVGRIGVEATGLFSPCTAVMGLAALIPSTIKHYVHPQMTFAFGRSGDVRAAWFRGAQLMFHSLALGGVAVVLGWYLLPFAIAQLLPKYVEATKATQISLVAGLLLQCSIAPVMSSIRAWKWLFLYAAIIAGARWLFPWMFSFWDDALTGVATGNAVAGLASVLLSLLIFLINISSKNQSDY